MNVEGQAPKGLIVFALAMFTAPATLSASSLTVWLERPDSRVVQAGNPFEIEVRAAFDAPLAAVEFQLTAAGEAQGAMVTRSADPVQPSGLAFISATSQIPFENGLPHDFGGMGESHDVLLAMTEPPFDALYLGDRVILERITVLPSGTGALTITLTTPQGATTRDDPDGTLFENTGVDAERATITVFVHSSCDHDSDGDVDLADFGSLQRCFSGSGAQAAGPCTDLFDDDADGDLDLTDLAVFVSNITGPQMPDTSTAVVVSDCVKEEQGGAAAVDANVDGIGGVDHRDLVYVRARLGTDDDQADANDDGVVDLLDLIVVRNRVGEGGTLPERERLRIAEIWPWESAEQPAWVELKYDARSGQTSYLNRFELVSQSNSPHANGLSTYPLVAEPGYAVVVQFDGWGAPEYLGDQPPYSGLRLHVPKPQPGQPLFDPLSDAYSLRYQDSPGHFIIVDRVAWGDIPEQHDSLNTGAEPLPDGGSIGRDPVETDTWRRYPTPTPGEANGMAPPTAYYPFPGAELAGDQVMRFVWLDYRLAAVQYQLQIGDDEALTSLQVDVTVDATVHDVAAPLPTGKYYWRVRTRYRAMEGAWSSALPFTVLSTEFQPLVLVGEGAWDDLGVPSADAAGSGSVVAIPWFAANGIEPPRKDTYMVCLECRQDSGPHAWDVPHPPMSCQHARHYQVQALVATINHYYGGSVTQDEISFSNRSARLAPEGSLLHGDPVLLSPQNAYLALNSALYIIPAEIRDFSTAPVRSLLMEGKPILGFLRILALPGAIARPILIYGHDDTGALERVIFYDPVVGSVPLSAPATLIGQAYYAADTPPSPGQMHLYVINDEDHDGLVDWSELLRFETNRQDPDTDHDGIGDKTEIWSYLFGQGRVPRIADMDGDGVRTEKDSDSDGDGCNDGIEDTNLNGTMGSYILGSFLSEKDETDPFYEETYEITLQMERLPAKLAFQECGHVKLMLKDSFGNQLKDKTVYLAVDPTMGSFGPAQGGQAIDTTQVVTSDSAWARQQFCALEKRGTAQIQASWTRCADTPEPVTATLNVTIVPYDWIFAVQEDAVLSGDVIEEDYHIRGWSSEPPREWGQIGERHLSKDQGKQELHGHFDYPGAADPGKWIDAVSLVFSPGANRDFTVLYIDGLPIVSGHTWTRTSEEDRPRTWRVNFFDDESPVIDWNNFPRYLSVRSGGSTKERPAPLLWWWTCSSSAERGRILRREPRSIPGGFEYRWVVLSYDDKVDVRAEFFFGDGDSEGLDIGYLHWQKGQGSTNVGFIPVGTVDGLAIRHYEHALWDLSWWMEGQPTGGTAVNHDVFSWRKSECYVGPPFGWTVTEYDEDSGPTVDELRQQISEPPAVHTLPDDIRFKRDYIGNDADELRVRGLTAPDYTVRMRSAP